MAKFDCLPASVNRIRRILGRRILNKELPTFVYRFDTRPPQMIRSEGFQPRPNSIGGVSMMEHVNNCYAIGHAHEGRATKYDSQFVSTGAYGMLKPIDSTFAQKLLETNLYKIDTTIALQTVSMITIGYYQKLVSSLLNPTRFYILYLYYHPLPHN